MVTYKKAQANFDMNTWYAFSGSDFLYNFKFLNKLKQIILGADYMKKCYLGNQAGLLTKTKSQPGIIWNSYI